MSNPRTLCVDVMGSTFTALLYLWADEESTEYTMTCTGTVRNGPYEMTIQDDPCEAEKGQSWTCEITWVSAGEVNYELVGGGEGHGGHDHGPIAGSIPLGSCGIPNPVVCPDL